jgi:hypothetical protein
MAKTITRSCHLYLRRIFEIRKIVKMIELWVCLDADIPSCRREERTPNIWIVSLTFNGKWLQKNLMLWTPILLRPVMPRRDEGKIEEIKKVCSEGSLFLMGRSQDLAFHLRFVVGYNACDILAANVCSEWQLKVATIKFYKHRPLHMWGRPAQLYPEEDSVLLEWVLQELTIPKFHSITQIRNKVFECFHSNHVCILSVLLVSYSGWNKPAQRN